MSDGNTPHSDHSEFDEVDFLANFDAPKYAALRNRLFTHLKEAEQREKPVYKTDAEEWDNGKALTHMVLQSLQTRNDLAHKTIARYARMHQTADIAIGGIGALVPYGALPALAVSIAAQYPLIYKPMIRDLASVYLAKPDRMMQSDVTDAILRDAVGMLYIDLGTEFFQELLLDSLGEMGASAFAACIPLVGGFIAASFDAILGATLTWRVGTMVSIYCQNGGKWLEDTRETYEKAKRMTGFNAKTSDRVSFDDIPVKIPEIRDSQLEYIGSLIQGMAATNNREQISSILKNMNFPSNYIHEAIRRYMPN